MKFVDDPKINLEDTPEEIADYMDTRESYRLMSPYIILPCCVLAAQSTDNLLDAAFGFLACLLCIHIGNCTICAVKETIVHRLVRAGKFANISITAQERITKCLSFVCYCILPFLVVCRIRHII